MTVLPPPTAEHRPPRTPLIRIVLSVLGLVFAVEFGVMLILPTLTPQRGTLFESTVDSVLLVALITPFVATAVRRRLRAERERERVIADLRAAFAQVKTLSGLLPICAHCKKIRDDGRYWKQVEVYVRDHSEAEFSHGICPECARKFYLQFLVLESYSPRAGE